ncbi:MAG: DUF5718 family protein, partial [Treponemataceae bacterium]|nr:DUF5718 family protein [Treponemataceae bacterium]
IKTKEENAPKAIFPTYIPSKNNLVPEYLKTFPFDSDKIVFPKNEENLQIEPECAILCDVLWNNDKVEKIIPIAFGASNDCSIRKDGAKKISQKKNWGSSSKGLAKNLIPIDEFSENGIINDYKIACFLIRGDKIFQYGETSFIKGYSYIYEKLLNWIIEKLNNQIDEGPTENLNSYLNYNNKINKMVFSIGATRYTDFGKTHFLQENDKSVVVLYPTEKYSDEEILSVVKNKDFSHSDISLLYQEIVIDIE